MIKLVNPDGQGKIAIGSLPEKNLHDLKTRISGVLKRHGLPDDRIEKAAQRIIDAVSHAHVGRAYQLEREGPGRPPSASGNILSVDVADCLREEGLSGNWLAAGDAAEDGALGLVAEIEAIAQTHLRQAGGETVGVMARPARISDARKLLGKVSRK